MINDVRVNGGYANGVLHKESEGSRRTKDSRALLTDPSTQKTTPVFDLSVNSLLHLISYKSNDNGLSNSLVSRVDLPAGAHFCYITTHYPIDAPTWSSVQTGPTSHIELGSAWSYSNHSCEPALELFVFSPDSEGRYPKRLPAKPDAPAVDGGDFGVCGEFRVARNRPLKRGDDLHWFYPATEFDVAKPFPCLCGAPSNICIGQQAGAKALSEEQAARYWLNPHIREMRKQSQ